MKAAFEEPEVEIVVFETVDILTTSLDFNLPDVPMS